MSNPSYSMSEIEAFANWYMNLYRMRYTKEKSISVALEFASQETDFVGDQYDYFNSGKITPKIKLTIILEFLAQARNDGEISYIAAGELEELINKHPEIYSELEVEVRRNPLMREAIVGVWVTGGTPAGKWLRQVLAKYNLEYRGP